MKKIAMAVLIAACAGAAFAASGDDVGTQPGIVNPDQGPPRGFDNVYGMNPNPPAYPSERDDRRWGWRDDRRARPYAAPYPQYPDGRPAWTSRGDRDGDGYADRHDRYPDDPRRH